MGDTIYCPKMLIRCSTFDRCQKCAEIEALPRVWMGIVHAADSKTPLSWMPFQLCMLTFTCFLPYEFGGKVLVEDLVCFRIVSVGFEVACESGIFGSLLLDHCLNIVCSITVEGDVLLVLKMDLKSDDVWEFFMHWELKESPYSFAGRDVAGIQI